MRMFDFVQADPHRRPLGTMESRVPSRFPEECRVCTRIRTAQKRFPRDPLKWGTLVQLSQPELRSSTHTKFRRATGKIFFSTSPISRLQLTPNQYPGQRQLLSSGTSPSKTFTDLNCRRGEFADILFLVILQQRWVPSSVRLTISNFSPAPDRTPLRTNH